MNDIKKITLIPIPELLEGLDSYEDFNVFSSMIRSDNSIYFYDVDVRHSNIFFNIYKDINFIGLKISRSSDCIIKFGSLSSYLYCTMYSDKLYDFVLEQIKDGIPEVVFLPDFMKYLKSIHNYPHYKRIELTDRLRKYIDEVKQINTEGDSEE